MTGKLSAFVAALMVASCGSSAASTTMDPAVYQQAIAGLGTITSTPDAAKQASVSYDPASTTATTVSATDAKGYAWTLSIPPGALTDKTTITLTPFAAVTSPSGHHLASGLNFGPDGLLFSKPATLSVVPPSSVSGFVPLYTVQSSGKQLEYAQMTGKDTAHIFHFSGGGAGDPDQGEANALDNWNTQLGLVQNYLKQPPTSLGTPPSVSLHCTPTTASGLNSNPAVQAYIQQAVQPELALAQSLQGAAQQLQFYGDDTDADSLGQYVTQLFNRIADRVTAAIKANNDNEDAFASLAATAVFVTGVINANGEGSPDATDSAAASWASHLAELSLKDVVSANKYSNYNEIVFLLNASIGFGGNVASLNADIAKAFTFNVTVNEDFDAPFTTIAGHPSTGNAVIDGFAYLATSLSGDATITGDGDIKPQATDKTVTDLLFNGAASLSYSKVDIDPELGATSSAPGFSANITATLKDVCGASPSMQVQQSAYGSTETTVLSGTSSSSTMMQDLMSSVAQAAGQANGNSALTVPIKDGQASGTVTFDIDDFFAAAGLPAGDLGQLKQIIKTVTLEYTVKHKGS